MTLLEQTTLQVSKQFIGSRETGTNRAPATSVITKSQLFIGRWMIGQPWCAAFAVYCVHMAAKRLGFRSVMPKTASSSALYAWARDHNKLLNTPSSGCVFVVRNGGRGDDDSTNNRGKTHIHTGLVHTVRPDGHLVTIEGNYGNAVKWNDDRTARGLDFIQIC